MLESDGKHLSWWYRDEQTYSNSTPITDTRVVTLRQMTIAAKDIVRMIKRGTIPSVVDPELPKSDSSNRNPRTEDNFGCDAPFESLSCTSVGFCCDIHDACYAAYNCDALSWLGLSSPACTLCNQTLVTCIGLGGTGQPSSCCASGNCGNERPIIDAGEGIAPADVGPYDQIGPGDPLTGGGWLRNGTPWGTIWTAGGWCKMPDGQILPCG